MVIQLFHTWLEASGIGNTFDELKEFMILDQFLSSLHPALRAFVKERRLTALEDAIQLGLPYTSSYCYF